MRIIEKLQNWLANLTWRHVFEFIVTCLFRALLGCLFSWMLVNFLSGCCEGGVCIPEWLYPQCRNQGGAYVE